VPPETDSRVTVAVITHNRRAELARTLDRLEDLPERPAVIVVDNGSADGSAAYVRWHYPAVTLITARTNLGAVGRNLALRRVTTPYVAFSDDDTWWDPGSLTLAADTLDAHPDVAAVTARIVVEPSGHDDPIMPELAGSPVPGRPGLPGPALLSIMAGASVLRADAFRTAGGFSPRLWLGGEEELLCTDLLSVGYHLCYLRGDRASPGIDGQGRDPAAPARHQEHALVHLAAPPSRLRLAADRRAGRHGAARRGVGGRVRRCRARPALGAARTPTGGTRP
jgi:GT2 family glycosyltransferase